MRRVGRRLGLPLLAALMLVLPRLAAAAELAVGGDRIEMPEPTGATAEPMPIWTWRPPGWVPGRPVVAVLHGLNRDAERYRDAWVAEAERDNVLLMVPEFSASKYPGNAWYQFGGVVDAANQPRPREAWSLFALDRAVSAVQRAAGAPEGPFTLYGHSAGAQFVHRYLLLTGAPRAGLVIIANSGSYSEPDLARPFPAGMQGAPVDEAVLREAMAHPVIIALGEEDNDPNHRTLPREAWAVAQGPHRFARGQHFFAMARDAAARLGAPFAWRLLTVPGVAHSNAGMARAIGPLLGAR